jgi:hypothetical protein
MLYCLQSCFVFHLEELDIQWMSAKYCAIEISACCECSMHAWPGGHSICRCYLMCVPDFCGLKEFLDNCFVHFFLLFFCLRIMFPQLFALFQILFLLLSCRNVAFSHFYARKGLIQLISRERNPRSIISVSAAGSFMLTTSTKLAGAHWASRLRRCLVLEVV